MNAGKLFIPVLFVTLFCQAQVSVPANRSVAKPSAPPAVCAASGESYVIGPSDVITVTVWKEPNLSGNLLVRPDGMISMSLLGDIQASGMNPLQLSDQIKTKLKRYIQNPNVTVVLTQINSKKVFLLGEVEKKGPVDMTPGMTVLQAIASAGGLTDFANTRKIYILRDEGGNHQRIAVRYKEALKGNNELNLILKSGDTIVVP